MAEPRRRPPGATEADTPVTKRVTVKAVANRERKRSEAAPPDGAPDAGRPTRDSFQNFLSQVGIQTANASSAGTYGFNPITRIRTLLEWMYRGSWIVGKAVDCVAEDMTREGVDFRGTLPPDDAEVMQKAIVRTAMWKRLCSTAKWGRLYGGALAFMMIDGQDPRTPLRVETVGRGMFKGLLVFDRWMVDPSLSDLVRDFGPDVGMPRTYQVTADAPALPLQRIHHSRVVRLEGVELPYWQKVAENLWSLSVVELLYDRLLAFDSTTQGVAQLVYRAYLRTLKIKDLREAVSAGGPAYENLLKQVSFMRTTQTNEGVTIVDAEDEVQFQAYTFSGLDSVLLQFGQQISGATGIPLVRLFGQSPAGLNSTGESDIRNYYDTVSQRQEQDLRGPLDVIFRVMARSEGVELPPGFGFDFRPLWQMSETEKADAASKTTTSVTEAFEAQLIDKATALKELRQSSWTTGLFSNVTDADIEAAKLEPAPMPLPGLPGQESTLAGLGPDGAGSAEGGGPPPPRPALPGPVKLPKLAAVR